MPNIYNVASSDKTQITVLTCMNATGLYLKPLIVFAGQRFAYNPLEDCPEAVFGRSNTGWMDSPGSRMSFWPVFDENYVKCPGVLFVDGHLTHCTLQASNFCRKKTLHCIAYFNMAAI